MVHLNSESAVDTAFDDHVHSDPAEPEKNLMRAILRGAMEDMRKGGEPHRDARRFFLCDDDSYLYSFLSVCTHLNLCPLTIRRMVGLREGAVAESIAA
jgi:hypothetical protein